MPFETNALDRVLHLLIFVAGAATLGVAAVGLLERFVATDRRIVGIRHLLIPAVALALLVIAERAYHAFT